jgi:hypothetical protein
MIASYDETNMIFLFQTSMSVMTLLWQLGVLRMLSAVTCQHTFYANVNLGLKVMEKWNVEVNITSNSYDFCHNKKNPPNLLQNENDYIVTTKILIFHASSSFTITTAATTYYY